MARNATVVLSAADKGRATKARKMLAYATEHGENVLVNFTKRDGSPRHIEGPVVSIVGHNDHEAVVVDTIEGPRSANLWTIRSVVLMGE